MSHQKFAVVTIDVTITELQLIRAIVKATRQLVLIDYLQIIAGMLPPLIVTSFTVVSSLGNLEQMLGCKAVNQVGHKHYLTRLCTSSAYC